MFRLSARSISRLGGVDEKLVSCVHRAITLTKVDFGVSPKLRIINVVSSFKLSKH